jgi:hypothetical protein
VQQMGLQMPTPCSMALPVEPPSHSVTPDSLPTHKRVSLEARFVGLGSRLWDSVLFVPDGTPLADQERIMGWMGLHARSGR